MSEIEVAAPVAIMKGRFNLFETPDGGYHVAYQKDPEFRGPDEPEVQHVEIPGFVINAAKMASESGMGVMDLVKMGMGARRERRNAQRGSDAE